MDGLGAVEYEQSGEVQHRQRHLHSGESWSLLSLLSGEPLEVVVLCHLSSKSTPVKQHRLNQTPIGLLFSSTSSPSLSLPPSLPQVLFNENQSQLVKLEVAVVKSGQPLKKLQCMEGYGTTPASGSHQFHFLKPCQVSGLLRLEKGAELQAITGAGFSLHTTGKHYFSLFKVN